MKYISTGIEDLWVCEPTIFNDDRGYFMEAFNKNDFKKNTGIEIEFVQQNESKSDYGVLRGLHLQTGQWAQAKFIRVLQGKVLDVVVDLRKDSQTFKQTYSIELSGENKKQLFVPRNFAHGFLVLEPNTIFTYSCDNFYSKESEVSLNFKDPIVNTDLLIPEQDLIMSEKDKNALDFKAVFDKMYGK